MLSPDGRARVPALGGGTILSIQYLRAAAAVCVVAAHASGVLVLQAGVDVFFVISGFIMWTITRTPQTPGHFLRNRLVRIVPLYWIATVLMAWHQHAPPAAIARSMLFVPYFGEKSEIWPVLVQGWTLNYEVFFYALVAAVLPLPRRTALAALVGGMVLLTAAGLLLAPQGAVAMTWTGTLLIEFCFGIAIAELRFASRLPSVAVGVALLVAAIVMFWLAPPTAVSRLARFLTWGVPGACIVLGTLSLERGGWVARSAALLAVGDASYAIYLFQSFPMKTLLGVAASAPVPIRVGFAVACITAMGLAISAWVERPLLALLRGRRPVAATSKA